ERLQERLDLEPFARRELEELHGRGLALAAVHGDGLFEGLGAAVVQIGTGVAEAPQGRRPPFATVGASLGPSGDDGARLAAALRPGDLRSQWPVIALGAGAVVRSLVPELGPHVVEEQVAVDSRHVAHLGRVTGRAADAGKGRAARGDWRRLF